MGIKKKDRRLHILGLIFKKLQQDGKYDTEGLTILSFLMNEWKISPTEIQQFEDATIPSEPDTVDVLEDKELPEG